jgi:hypothetical protein
MLKEVRRGIGEYSENILNGVNTSGRYSNEELVDNINTAQRVVHQIVSRRLPDVFYATASITGVGSVFTLPWDYGSKREFRDEDGYHVYPIVQSGIRRPTQTGSDKRYYRKGNTLVVDKAGITETYILHYITKPRDLDQGMASAGGALSLTLATLVSKNIDDYYNSMQIENSTQDWVDTVSDYTGSTRVCTLSAETGVANDMYGFISELPELFHFLLPMWAVATIKGTDISNWSGMLAETLRTFAGSEQDISPEETWCQYPASHNVNPIDGLLGY